MTDGGIVDLTSFLFGGVSAESVSTEGYTSLSYPLELPSVSGFVSCSWSKDEVVAVAESPFTLQRQIYRHSGARWRVTIVMPPMRQEHALAWSSFLLNLGGEYGTFYFGDVFNPTPKGLSWGSPVVNGSMNSGRILTTRGWQENVTGILKAGDKIQVGAYLYQVTRDVNSDGAGGATLDIWPRLRVSPNDNDLIITNNPRGLFQLATSSLSLCSFDLTGIAKVPSFDIIEAI